jgi:hypothetical protein
MTVRYAKENGITPEQYIKKNMESLKPGFIYRSTTYSKKRVD